MATTMIIIISHSGEPQGRRTAAFACSISAAMSFIGLNRTSGSSACGDGVNPNFA